MTSPLLNLPGAVPATGVDAGTASHYGDPLAEQRALETGAAFVDRSTRDVLVVPGEDRLSWLHTITSQHVSNLEAGDSTEALVLSPHGHVEQHWQLTELDGQVWIDTEPGAADEVYGYLDKMRFLSRVEPAVVTAKWAVLSAAGPRVGEVLADAGLPPPPAPGRAAALPGGGFLRGMPDGSVDLIGPRAELATIVAKLTAAGAQPAGAWAWEALRVAARRPRLGLETDHRTIPHEVYWIGTAVHLDKGCYRGQETVARVQNLGRPPRRLVLLYLSGERDELPPPGTPVESEGRAVGFLGTSAYHHELGPIALAMVKRTVPDDASLVIAGNPASVA
ncbi:MAG TPA: folate-binding protein [Jatrophihabitantaceae bacterium]|nr:folate-binding protein [Jatrophihabitantaceae bacterium]